MLTSKNALPLAKPDVQYCAFCHNPSNASAAGAYCCRACEILDQNVTQFLRSSAPASGSYAHYDDHDFQDLYRHQQGEYPYVFYAEGLHCTSCVHLLENLPLYDQGVQEARVHFSQSTVAVRLGPEASLAHTAEVIEQLGYKPSLISPQEDLQAKYQQENRVFLKRIAVAGFCAGNIMLFVIPVYAGLAGSWVQVFNFISFLLFLPILFFSAIPFYRGAWTALKYKTINMDLPIALAMLAGFVLSSYNLWRGRGEIYFDSTASFLFLILSSRYLLKRIQQNYLAPYRLKSLFTRENYLKEINGTQSFVPGAQVQVGDVLQIQRGQLLPSDARLLSPRATLDMALFNGESLPRVFVHGMDLYAGTQVLDEKIQIEITTAFAQSRLGKLLEELENGEAIKSPFVALTDRLAQKLVSAVFALALIFFFGYLVIYPSEMQEAFNRSLALLVLACPCALAFGSPLTFGLALKKAQTLGLLIKNADSLEKILKIKNIFFDKTGTLTEGQFKLAYTEPNELPQDLRRSILSLEQQSYHPLAFALREAWPDISLNLKVQEAQEILGRGVQGLIDGQRYELRPLAESVHEEELAIELLQNGQSRCRLYFTDHLRSDSADVVTELQNQGLTCYLLSGDKKSRCEAVAAACSIPKKNVFSELFPEDKKAQIQQHRNTCMIGDGANDALSLQIADVGIAVKGSVDLSLSSADIYFTRGGLAPVRDLLSLAQRTQVVLKRNLTLSLLYNVIGGTLALLGLIDPMMAAILMPVSSAAILLSSLWGFR